MITLFEHVSQLLGLPSGLLAALCAVESGHNPNALRPHDGGRSSFGICQVKYTTAKQVMPTVKPSDLFDAEMNMMVAGLYLKSKMTRYNNLDKAIAAYNSGTLRLDVNGQIKNMQYVRKVKSQWKIQRRKAALAKVF